MSAFGYRKADDLPAIIPVFPLAGAILFPRGSLPLNIFEPRYLNMIDDALGAQRLIGMIQPAHSEEDSASPELAPVGCVGRITSFTETEDGRYLITLTGIARFRVARELPGSAPYRSVQADWSSFASDLSQHEIGAALDREALARALRLFAEARGFDVDWQAADDAPAEMLVNAVAAAVPFDTIEKQVLLEAETVADRCDLLVALLELASTDGDSGMQ